MSPSERATAEAFLKAEPPAPRWTIYSSTGAVLARLPTRVGLDELVEAFDHPGAMVVFRRSETEFDICKSR